MPLQLERRWQSVHTFIQQLYHAIVAAIDFDFANPDRTRRFNSHRRVGRSNPGAAHPPKAFPHPLKKPRPILVPLIAIVFGNEIGNTRPIFAVDCVKEMFCVEPNLMLRPPKPEQIYADENCNGQNADSCFTKRNRHTRRNDTTSGSNPRRIRLLDAKSWQLRVDVLARFSIHHSSVGTRHRVRRSQSANVDCSRSTTDRTEV